MVEGWSSSSSVETPEQAGDKSVLLGLVIGGLLVFGLCVGGMAVLIGFVEGLDDEEFSEVSEWDEDPDDRVKWRMELTVAERGRLREDGHLLPDETLVWLYCTEDDISAEGSMTTDRRLVSWWTDEDTEDVEEESLALTDVASMRLDWSDEDSWYTYLVALDAEENELWLWLSPTDQLDRVAVEKVEDLVIDANPDFEGLSEEP